MVVVVVVVGDLALLAGFTLLSGVQWSGRREVYGRVVVDVAVIQGQSVSVAVAVVVQVGEAVVVVVVVVVVLVSVLVVWRS